MKICPRCKLEKSEEDFPIAGKRRFSYCSICKPEYQRERYLARRKTILAKKKVSQKVKYGTYRELVRQAKNKPCADCGVSYPSYVMDLDHRQDVIKISNVSEMPTQFGKQVILEEIAKCDVVCSNCHRERTFQRRLGVAQLEERSVRIGEAAGSGPAT